MRQIPRSRTTLIATTVAALATSALTLAPPAAATSVPPKPSGHVDVTAPDLVRAGMRPRLRVFVNAMADASGPRGWVRVVVRERGGDWAWRDRARYRDKPLVFRLAQLRDAGRYDVRVTFTASQRSGTPSGSARDLIRVYELND